MWEAYQLGNEDLLWASTVFQGGIAGRQEATCGAISSAAVCLGLRHRYPLADNEKAKAARKAASDDAAELVRSFIEKYGALTCIDLIGVDLADEAAAKKAIASGLLEECDKRILYVIEKLYELDKKRSVTEKPRK
jgi:C_GCAxxG_C_C family probable redox protein